MLALAFVAGTWEDILPGIDLVAAEEAPLSSSLPDGPMGAKDADDGSRLTLSPLEPVLISEVYVAVPILLQIHLFQNPVPLAPSTVAVRRIPHVPKPSAYV
jgi:hypothetical protein